MDFEELINEKCCACERIIGDHGKHINGIILDRRAQWDRLTAGNVITGEKGKAIAIVCDECFDKHRHIKYAIRYDGKGKVVYVPVDDLEPVSQ